MRTQRVVVIGGGITGLTFAYTLKTEAARRGVAVELALLDQGPQPGGHARTIRDDGWLVEAGPNGFLDREPETLALVSELGLDSQIVTARDAMRRRFLVLRQCLHRLPDSPATLFGSTALGWRAKLRMALEPFASGPPEGVDETVFDFARRRIGREAAEVLVDTAVSGISAGDSRALSVRAQFPQMVEMERAYGSLVRAMAARRRNGVGPGRLVSFRDGLGAVTEALGRALGGAVQPATAATAIERTAEAWQIRTSSGVVLAADHVVLSLPARRAAEIVQRFDPALSRDLAQIPYVGVSVAALGYPADAFARPLDGYGYLVARTEGLATLGVLWESSVFPGRAPEGCALIRVLVGGARRPDVADQDSAATLALARAELAQVMGVSTPPLKAWVFRWPAAIAQYTVGHLERVARIRTRAAQHPGLTLCGTAYDGASFNSAVASARRAARALVSGLSL